RQHAHGGADQHAQQREEEVLRLHGRREPLEQQSPAVHQNIRPSHPSAGPHGSESPIRPPNTICTISPITSPMTKPSHHRQAPSAQATMPNSAAAAGAQPTTSTSSGGRGARRRSSPA